MNQTHRKIRIGRVVADKANKTVVVAVRWQQRHRLYRKSIRKITKFYVHDELNTCSIGDQVRIVETRPISKIKRWRILEVLASIEVPDVHPSEIDSSITEATSLTGVEGSVEEDGPVAEAEGSVEEDGPVAEAEGSVEEDGPVAEAEGSVEQTPTEKNIDEGKR